MKHPSLLALLLFACSLKPPNFSAAASNTAALVAAVRDGAEGATIRMKIRK